MSGDEIIALIVSALLAGYWLQWIFLWCPRGLKLERNPAGRWFAQIMPLMVTLLLLAVLRCWSSHDVRSSVLYLGFYSLMGLAWLTVTVTAFGALGFDLRYDWIDSRNPAAALCGAGLMLGVTLAFGGANVGDGPGWWVVVFSALLSTGALWLGLVLLNFSADMMERVTVNRDTSLATRLAGFFLCGGALAGRAVAGDWVSVSGTVTDFLHAGRPLFAAMLALAAVEFAARRTRLPLGVSVALVMAELMASGGYLLWLGVW
ncbi:MAG: hypothetical protein LBD30_01905 [Verrucomicrobiales bacterium]|nr:hypothetical protein [Verrucomicrobiales bacterium]